MADPRLAKGLVEEDALYETRGLNLVDPEEHLIADERELDKDLRGRRSSRRGSSGSRSSSSSSSGSRNGSSSAGRRLHADYKGKGRALEDRGTIDGAGYHTTVSSASRSRYDSGLASEPPSPPRYDDEGNSQDDRQAFYDEPKRSKGKAAYHPYSTYAKDDDAPLYDDPDGGSIPLHTRSHRSPPGNTSTHIRLDEGEEDDDGDRPSRPPAQHLSRRSINGHRRGRNNSIIGNILTPSNPLDVSGNTTKQELRQRYWQNIAISGLFILAWYCCSTLISLYNKWMFSPEHYGFVYPLFVTSCHMLVQFILCSIVLSVFPSLRPAKRPNPRDYTTKAIPCGLATGLDIGLSNLSLKTITLSFYTMCKSSVLGFVLLFAFLFKLERPTLPLIGIIAIITAGVVMMVSSETQFNMVGMAQVLTASCLSGLRWSLTQILLDRESMGMNNPFATLFWLAPIMGICLALCSIFIEGWFTVFSSEFFQGFDRILVTIGVIVLPGCIAFTMNVAEFGLIQRTSVVTLSVAGIFKEVATIFLSTVVFHDELTPINISGLCVALFGIALYNYLKFRTYKEKERETLKGKGGAAVPTENGGSYHPSSTDDPEGQFQLIGENDFDSSDDDDESDRDETERKWAKEGKSPPHRRLEGHGSGNGDLLFNGQQGQDYPPAAHIQHLPPPPPPPLLQHGKQSLDAETRDMEREIEKDPELVQLDRQEEDLLSEMESRSSSKTAGERKE